MWNPRSFSLAALSLAAVVASAQQKVPFDPKFNIPVAPTGLAHRPLPDHPMEFDTAEGQKIRVVVVTKGLEYPWSAAFLPDGSMLVTERPGRLRIIRDPGHNAVLDPKPIAGAPVSYWAAESGAPGAVHGYMDIALHPKFGENHLV
jgi:aldose sugar dehydrogenase